MKLKIIKIFFCFVLVWFSFFFHVKIIHFDMILKFSVRALKFSVRVLKISENKSEMVF